MEKLMDNLMDHLFYFGITIALCGLAFTYNAVVGYGVAALVGFLYITKITVFIIDNGVTDDDENRIS